MNKKIVIVDYDMGNTLSVVNALRKLEIDALVSNKKEDIENSLALILPGVGAFNEAMQNLKKHGLIEILNETVLVNKKPILGICLGMQIMADTSEEMGRTEGLGWISGNVKKIDISDVRIPHVGWNSIEVLNDTPLFKNIPSDTHFYFDHSYCYICDEEFKSSYTLYKDLITSSIQKDNIFATQFHPEKSQNMGLRLLKNFLNYVKEQSC